MPIMKHLTVGALVAALSVPALGTVALTLSTEPAFAKNKDRGKSKDRDRTKRERPDKRDSKSRGSGRTKETGRTKAAVKTSNGSVRSVLKGANASNASARALEVASPNSRVGKAALYRDAVLAATTADEAAAAVATMLEELEATDPGFTSEETQAVIDGLEATKQGLMDQETALLAEQEELNSKTELTEEEQVRLGEIEGELETVRTQHSENADALASANDDLTTATEYEAELDRLQAELTKAEEAAEGAETGQQDALLALTDGRDISENVEAMAELHSNLGLPAEEPELPEEEMPEETDEDSEEVTSDS
ncbi:hypothetical protein K3556_00225 [Aliiroseovarius sp. M344]|uniref:hypothetical protein n=1 Tax=Aliiroseovarius sp. M344 TaxID=2867010 RepID=UPI0021AD7428|nr:hypothetical protein [Aliiroseovarius sp. M344]UWQ14359.1 hypothetical protein K3556_00225 [Aliiroseovarius sp. M344]